MRALPLLVSGKTTRISVRGVVTLTETHRSGVPCSLATNIETYDTTSGVTDLHPATAGKCFTSLRSRASWDDLWCGGSGAIRMGSIPHPALHETPVGRRRTALSVL